MYKSIDLGAKPFYLDEKQRSWVYDTLASMSDEEKAGQLFCVLADEYSFEELRALAREKHVGGILFRPVKTAKEIGEAFKVLDTEAKFPLLKAANLEEGGAGGASDGTLYGWPMLVAATNDEEEARRHALVCAAEGKAAGVNWTFSPVCDLDLNYLNPITNVRTFGSDTGRVCRMAGAYAETMQSHGIAACAKHFPGDGVDYRDHHLHPSYNTLGAEEWFRSYGTVYRKLIDGGLLSVMVGHIVQPELALYVNPGLELEDIMPASLSRELLGGILRGELNFNGLITTDATIMGGYCMAMPRAEAVPASIQRGCDMLVFSTDIYADYEYILAGLEKGLLSRERLDEAVTRILALKARVCIGDSPAPDVNAARWARECAEKAITLVKNKEDVLPLSTERFKTVRLVSLGDDKAYDCSIADTVEAMLMEAGFEVERYDPFADDLHSPNGLPADRLTLYLANYQTASNQTTVRINFCPKHALDIPRYVNEEKSVFVSFSNPYHLQDVPRVRTYINAYSATKTIIEATVEKLLGKGEFAGLSPVDAFCGLLDTRL